MCRAGSRFRLEFWGRSCSAAARHRLPLSHRFNNSMADRRLAEEVMWELDEAGAVYFAMTLRSPPFSNYLV